MFRIGPDGTVFENTVTGRTFPIQPPEDADAALRTLGETVEEDLFLLQETPSGHLCVAFMCCFPSGFDPSEKFGNLLKDIHAPVPSYSKIGASMERFFSKLQVGKSVKRLNVRLFFYRQTEMGLPLCPKQSFNNSSPVVRSNQQRLVYAGKPHQRRRGGGCFGRQHRCEPGNVGTHHVQRIFQLTCGRHISAWSSKP